MHDQTITFQVLGDPAPQGSKRHVGNGILVESSKKLRPWRADVAWAARAQRQAEGMDAAITGPVRVGIDFFLRRPKRVKSKADRPATRPDLDKLTRAVLDGICSGGLIVDDSQVARLAVEKWWAWDDIHWLEEQGQSPRPALNVPGCVIHIRRL